MKITFHGAAENVTGSKHLIETNGLKILLDCGLFQGRRDLANKLNSGFAFDPKEIHAVILSHAHTDHCGLLPLLVRSGFTGKIYATGATADIAEFIMKDSAAIQEQDAAYINKHLQPGQQPIVPHFTVADVDSAMSHFVRIPYFRLSQEWTQLSDAEHGNVRFKFYDAGHILGSAVTLLESTENGITKRLGFSGDLGQPAVPILHDPEFITEQIDAMIMECTYGDRNHRPLQVAVDALTEIIKSAVANKSKIITPAFSLGRTQEILYIMHRLIDEGKIPDIPVYLDSPLAEDLTAIFAEHAEDFGDQVKIDFTNGNVPFRFVDLRYVKSVEESKSLQKTPGPHVVLSASGMCEGGRILHHLKSSIGDPNAYVLLTGFQAENTLGRKIQEGMMPVRILNEMYDVKAKVITLDEFSAHADQNGLYGYVQHLANLKQMYLVHTEVPAAQAFQAFVHTQNPSLNVTIPVMNQSFEI